MVDDFRRPFAAPPTIFGVAFLIGLGVDLVYPQPLLPLWPQLAIGAVFVVLGVLFISSSMRSIDEAGTTYDPYAPSTELVTSGIYGYTRNPGYLGLAVIQLGLAFLLDSPWIAIAAFIAVLVTTVAVIRLEEEKLARTFGNDYHEYLTRVRRWI